MFRRATQMAGQAKFTIVVLLVLLVLLLDRQAHANASINPYKVLGLARNADERQIRNAYRKLAKEWHPDVNKSPEAHEKFMQINQAYEILSDSERRSMYDEYGTTSEPRQGGGYQRESYDQFFGDFPFQGFESFFGGRGFRFNFKEGGGQNRKSSEEAVNKKLFDETILPNSYQKPFLVYCYTEFCYSCMTVEGLWDTLKQELKNIGIGAGHLDASWNRELVKYFGISSVPSIVGVVNGKVFHFRGEYSLKSMREFVRKLIPSKLVVEVSKRDFNDTLHETISDNKVLAVFVYHSSQVSLRYQMPCFQMSSYIKCVSIKQNSIDSSTSDFLRENFRIDGLDELKQETLVIFRENLLMAPVTPNVVHFSYKPVAVVRLGEIPYSTVQQTFEANKYLYLPRLSSMQHFYDLCPTWTPVTFDATILKIFCVVFLSDSVNKMPTTLFDNFAKSKLIKKINGDEFFTQNAQFLYVYQDVQTDFIDSLAKFSKGKNAAAASKNENKIVILKRIDDKSISYDWFENLNKDNKELNAGHFSLIQQLDVIKANLRSIVNGEKRLQYKMAIPHFYTESLQGLLAAILDYLDDVRVYFAERFSWDSVLGNSSYMMIMFCTVLFIWLMMMLSSEKSNPNAATAGAGRAQQQQQQAKKETPSNYRSRPSNGAQRHASFRAGSGGASGETHSSFTTQSEASFESSPAPSADEDRHALVHFDCKEMTPKSYKQLINDVPNGTRTILLIVDNSNKAKLLELFASVCARFMHRRYQLKFAYLNVDTFSGQKWLNEIKYDRYKPLGDDELVQNGRTDRDDDDEDDDGSSTSSSLSDSDDGFVLDDNMTVNSEILAKSRKQARKLSKLDASDHVVLAINPYKKFYMVFTLSDDSDAAAKSDFDAAMGFEDVGAYASAHTGRAARFTRELANWLDKITEGLCLNKCYVDEWPSLS